MVSDFFKNHQVRSIFLAGLASLFPLSINAQEISTIGLPPGKVLVDDQVEFAVNMKSTGWTDSCGLHVDFGNSTSKDIRATANKQDNFSVKVTYKYPVTGNFNVTVTGTTIFSGLNTVIPCTGRPLSFPVNVISPESISSSLGDPREAELKSREEELTRLEAEAKLRQEKAQLLLREQEAKRREQGLAKREADLRRLEQETNRLQQQVDAQSQTIAPPLASPIQTATPAAQPTMVVQSAQPQPVIVQPPQSTVVYQEFVPPQAFVVEGPVFYDAYPGMVFYPIYVDFPGSCFCIMPMRFVDGVWLGVGGNVIYRGNFVYHTAPTIQINVWRSNGGVVNGVRPIRGAFENREGRLVPIPPPGSVHARAMEAARLAPQQSQQKIQTPAAQQGQNPQPKPEPAQQKSCGKKDKKC